ncbi:MAG: serine/threonine-protein phosphatase [Nitriliruptoraceae bacterium]|nr:serine/threonine-protein phosphatase [Nitriliruptoraceae bacterium]
MIVQQLRWGSGSHPGHVRAVNEDALIAGPRVFAVADGMGGHAAGEVASSLLISAIADAAERAPVSQETVRAAVVDGRARMRDVVARRPSAAGMGATLAGVAWCDGAAPDEVLVFHAGDARVYRVHDGQLEACTRDHSLVQERIDAGSLAVDEAATHRDRHVVTRAVSPATEVEVTIDRQRAQVGDRWLVCSDGLTDIVEEAQLRTVLASGAAAPETSARLVAVALEAGAPDNVSAIVVDVVAAASPATPVPADGRDGAATVPRRGDEVGR